MALMPASNMNGIEGIAIVIVVFVGFCLLGAFLIGPLAVVGTLVGGRLRGVGFVSALTAIFVGAVGVVLAAAAYLYLGAMFEGVLAAVLLLPPLVSLTLGGIALWLRRKRATARAV